MTVSLIRTDQPIRASLKAKVNILISIFPEFRIYKQGDLVKRMSNIKGSLKSPTNFSSALNGKYAYDDSFIEAFHMFFGLERFNVPILAWGKSDYEFETEVRGLVVRNGELLALAQKHSSKLQLTLARSEFAAFGYGDDEMPETNFLEGYSHFKVGETCLIGCEAPEREGRFVFVTSYFDKSNAKMYGFLNKFMDVRGHATTTISPRSIPVRKPGGRNELFVFFWPEARNLPEKPGSSFFRPSSQALDGTVSVADVRAMVQLVLDEQGVDLGTPAPDMAALRYFVDEGSGPA